MKYLWRFIAVKEYCIWRKDGRVESIVMKYKILIHDNDGNIIRTAKIFNRDTAVRAYRLRINTFRKDMAWINMTRIWQIKNGLNYGRY